MNPSRARPLAKLSMFCSAMPMEMKRSGEVSRKRSISVELVRSAESTNTFGLSAAQRTRFFACTLVTISGPDCTFFSDEPGCAAGIFMPHSSS